MTVATPAKTRKPRTTPASLIASEFAARQPLPAPEPAATSNATSPVILVFILAVAAIGLFQVAIGLSTIIWQATKFIATKAAEFIAIQRGGQPIDFRVYAPIFELT